MAHELTHVVQQGKAIAPKYVQRKISYKDPTFNKTNTIDTVLGGGTLLALTSPTINGTVLPDHNTNAAGQVIFKAFEGLSLKNTGTGNVCIYNEPNIEVSANIAIIEAPVNNKWIGATNGNTVETRNANCKGKTNIPVEITGTPNAQAIYDKVRANEMEHYDDLKLLSKEHLEKLITFLTSFKAPGATNDSDCRKAFLAFVENKDVLAIKEFLDKLGAKVTERDVKPGAHLFHSTVNIAGNCSKIDVVIKT